MSTYRGEYLNCVKLQGVVTLIRPVEPFATRTKNVIKRSRGNLELNQAIKEGVFQIANQKLRGTM